MKYRQNSGTALPLPPKAAADQNTLLGLDTTSLLIFISDYNLCQPVIATNSSLTVVPVCTTDVHLPDTYPSSG